MPPLSSAANWFTSVFPIWGWPRLTRQTGKLVWQVKDGAGMLSESGDKTFVVTKGGRLVAMDNAKAKQLYSVNVGPAR